MKIGFTGTREGMKLCQETALLRWLEDHLQPHSEVHQGCCVGADAEFVSLVEMCRSEVEIHAHPSHWESLTDKQALAASKVQYYPMPPLERNAVIVDSSDVLLAAPLGKEELRSGTWMTVRYARKQQKHIVIFHPDGRITEENKPTTDTHNDEGASITHPQPESTH